MAKPPQLFPGSRPRGWPGDRLVLAGAGVTLAALAFVQRQNHQQQLLLDQARTRALILGVQLPTDLRLYVLGGRNG